MGRIGLDQVFHTNVLVGSATRAQVFVEAQDELVMIVLNIPGLRTCKSHGQETGQVEVYCFNLLARL
jgi:hypothetical protein